MGIIYQLITGGPHRGLLKLIVSQWEIHPLFLSVFLLGVLVRFGLGSNSTAGAAIREEGTHRGSGSCGFQWDLTHPGGANHQELGKIRIECRDFGAYF